MWQEWNPGLLTSGPVTFAYQTPEARQEGQCPHFLPRGLLAWGRGVTRKCPLGTADVAEASVSPACLSVGPPPGPATIMNTEWGGPWAGWNQSCSPRSPRPAPPSEVVPGNFSHGWQWLQGGETVSEALKEESGRQQKRESNP